MYNYATGYAGGRIDNESIGHTSKSGYNIGFTVPISTEEELSVVLGLFSLRRLILFLFVTIILIIIIGFPALCDYIGYS